MKHRLALMVALPALMLAACEDEPAAPSDDDARVASGEVMEGTISDAMIPLDQLRSQAPLAEPEPGEGSSGSNDGGGGQTPEQPAPAEDAAPDEPAPDPVQPEPGPAPAEPAPAE